MSARVRVRNDVDGRLVAVKVALDVADEARLVREAAMLTAIRQPGVVGFLRLSPGVDGLELVTQWVGARSLADVVPLPAHEAAAVVGALAATVADLHSRGVVHRGVEPRHVLLDRDGRPVLCSFALAQFTPTTRGEPASGIDYAPDVHTDIDPCARPSDDVAALGELLLAATARVEPDDLVPSRRLGRRAGDHLHRSLLTIADHARAHDPASRPNAAALAATLADLAPAASLPACRESDSSDAIGATGPSLGTAGIHRDLERLRLTAADPKPRRWRVWPFAAMVAGVAFAIIAIGSIASTSLRASPIGDGASTGSDGAHPTLLASPLSTSSTIPSPILPASTSQGSISADSSPAIEIDGRRFSVGAPGDLVAVAPWRCDGVPRALVLRPRTGELFLFDEVPEVEHDAVSFATITDSSELVAVDPADACPVPAVLHVDGRVTDVELPPPPA